METIKELEDWMIDKSIKNIFIPNNRSNRYVTDTGEGLEDIYGLYIWYSMDEKGNRTDIKYFSSERDAVKFVHKYLIENYK